MYLLIHHYSSVIISPNQYMDDTLGIDNRSGLIKYEEIISQNISDLVKIFKKMRREATS